MDIFSSLLVIYIMILFIQNQFLSKKNRRLREKIILLEREGKNQKSNFIINKMMIPILLALLSDACRDFFNALLAFIFKSY